MNKGNMTNEIIQLYRRIISERNVNMFYMQSIAYYKDLLEDVDKKLRFLSEFSALPRANA